MKIFDKVDKFYPQCTVYPLYSFNIMYKLCERNKYKEVIYKNVKEYWTNMRNIMERFGIQIENDRMNSRPEFKKAVFAKTNGKCCVPGCNCDAVDAHHIMDRHLWYQGGYHLSNGAALCRQHHLDAEEGKITPKDCIEYMHISPSTIKEPDELKTALTFGEYYTLLMSGKINKWGE